ncbi:MAG: hypothetical protein ACYC61_11425, partial [Isosphaeraceae bacterium]
MKRQFVAGVMGLALTGCAHFRSEAPKGPGQKNPPEPISMKPVPSIYDTINRGTGNPVIAQSALGNPNDPRWAGQAPPPGAGGPAFTNPAQPSPAMQPTQMADTGAPAGSTAASAPAGPTSNWSGPAAAATLSPMASSRPAAPAPRTWADPTPSPGNGGGLEESVAMPAGDLKAAAAAAGT